MCVMIWTEFVWIVSVGYTESGFSEKCNGFSRSLKDINLLTVRRSVLFSNIVLLDMK
jgi:hypothetical protein